MCDCFIVGFTICPAGLTSKILAVAPSVSPFKGHRDIYFQGPLIQPEIAYKIS